jgi:G:T-mismatch repair DNA endonuclease (very short patch repair protein)
MRSNSMEQLPNREYKSRQILRLAIRLTGSHIDPRRYDFVGRTDSTSTVPVPKIVYVRYLVSWYRYIQSHQEPRYRTYYYLTYQ